MKKFIAIIPSRYASSRFPGKPLADIAGKIMIERVYDQVCQSVDDVWVATDDERISEAVLGFGGNVVMTSAEHRSGTDRCAEAVRNIEAITGETYEVVINIQGDEPFIQPGQIVSIRNTFVGQPETEIATLIQRIKSTDVLLNPAEAKVALDHQGNAIYFSRLPIPMVFKQDQAEWLSHYPYYCHVGVYAYRKDILQKISLLAEGNLERAESLEQLRWLENGYKIKTAITDFCSVGIDTPEDLQRIVAEGVEKYYEQE